MLTLRKRQNYFARSLTSQNYLSLRGINSQEYIPSAIRVIAEGVFRNGAKIMVSSGTKSLYRFAGWYKARAILFLRPRRLVYRRRGRRQKLKEFYFVPSANTRSCFGRRVARKTTSPHKDSRFHASRSFGRTDHESPRISVCACPFALYAAGLRAFPSSKICTRNCQLAWRTSTNTTDKPYRARKRARARTRNPFSDRFERGKRVKSAETITIFSYNFQVFSRLYVERTGVSPRHQQFSPFSTITRDSSRK